MVKRTALTIYPDVIQKDDTNINACVPVKESSPLRALRECPPHRPELLHGLAFDHRSQLMDMAHATGASPLRIPHIKQLIFQASQVAAKRCNIESYAGILVDDRFGHAVIEQATNKGIWIGRPISRPESRPLEFEGDIQEIHNWPQKHTVKCLVSYHPDDDPALKAKQDQQILRLNDVLKQSNHDFLLEIVTPRGTTVKTDTFARILTGFYKLGVKPNWLKIPAQTKEAWKEINEVITDKDPQCSGVLIMGYNAHIDKLEEAFHVGSAFPCVKGYMVGRSIFANPAFAWFQGRLDDAQCIEQIASKYTQLINVWKKASQQAGLGYDA